MHYPSPVETPSSRSKVNRDPLNPRFFALPRRRTDVVYQILNRHNIKSQMEVHIRAYASYRTAFAAGRRGNKSFYHPIFFISVVTAGTAAEKGYFGPWRQCKLLLYGREWCGQSVSRFQPVCKSPVLRA